VILQVSVNPAASRTLRDRRLRRMLDRRECLVWHACAPAGRRTVDMVNARRLLPAFILMCSTSMASTSLLYIGTQNPEKMGLAVAEFDTDTGALSAPRLIIETRDPAHFTMSADGRHLYLCNTGTPGGVSAFAVENRKTGALKFLNFKEARGRGPSFISVDRSGRYVLDANYGGGYVEVFSLSADGTLDRQTALVQHEGSSVHPQRQNKPYAHWFATDPSNRFALAADLGTDHIVVYRFDDNTGQLAPNDPPAVKVNGGSGPRHLAFHPDGRWVYAVQELSNEVVAFRWDGAKGSLAQFQAVKTLGEGFTGPNTAAEIMVRKDGRFLYVSNRGEDTLVVYAIDAQTGELTLQQRVPARGRVPRFFTFDPSGKWLIVGAQEGNTLGVFRVDGKSGELAAQGEPVPLVKPMGVVFLP
jgi:6-phosphogluconolactonase